MWLPLWGPLYGSDPMTQDVHPSHSNFHLFFIFFKHVLNFEKKENFLKYFSLFTLYLKRRNLEFLFYYNFKYTNSFNEVFFGEIELPWAFFWLEKTKISPYIFFMKNKKKNPTNYFSLEFFFFFSYWRKFYICKPKRIYRKF